jgi:hypothetical protein
MGGLTIGSSSFDRPDPETAAALARLYDLDLADDPGDLDLYLALADRVEGPILELAVGTGRLAIPLVEAGHGSPAWTSIRRCRACPRARARSAGEDRLTLVEADIVGSACGTSRRTVVHRPELAARPSDPGRPAGGASSDNDHRHGGLAVVDWLPDADGLAHFDGRSC